MKSLLVILAIFAVAAYAKRAENDPVHLMHKTGFEIASPLTLSEMQTGKTPFGTKLDKTPQVDYAKLGLQPQGYTAFGTPIISPAKVQKALENERFKCSSGVCCNMAKGLFKENTEPCDDDPLQPCMQPAGMCPGGAAYCSKMEPKPDLTICPGGQCKSGVCQLRPCEEGQCCLNGRPRPNGMQCVGGKCSKGVCVATPAPQPIVITVPAPQPAPLPQAPIAIPINVRRKIQFPKVSPNASSAEKKAARRIARLLKKARQEKDAKLHPILDKIPGFGKKSNAAAKAGIAPKKDAPVIQQKK